MKQDQMLLGDAAGLCFKSGNAVILRGGSEAKILIRLLQTALRGRIKISRISGRCSTTIVEDTSREVATEMMKLNDYIDVLIPRGGAGLIKAVVIMQQYLLLKLEQETVIYM